MDGEGHGTRLLRLDGRTPCLEHLVSHNSAIGDTISCNAPCSAIGFRGKLFLQYPPSKACLWIAIGHLYRKKWGCSSDSLRYHRKHSATGVLLHLSRDMGGYFGWVSKLEHVDTKHLCMLSYPNRTHSVSAVPHWRICKCR